MAATCKPFTKVSRRWAAALHRQSPDDLRFAPMNYRERARQSYVGANPLAARTKTPGIRRWQRISRPSAPPLRNPALGTPRVSRCDKRRLVGRSHCASKAHNRHQIGRILSCTKGSNRWSLVLGFAGGAIGIYSARRLFVCPRSNVRALHASAAAELGQLVGEDWR